MGTMKWRVFRVVVRVWSTKSEIAVVAYVWIEPWGTQASFWLRRYVWSILHRGWASFSHLPHLLVQLAYWLLEIAFVHLPFLYLVASHHVIVYSLKVLPHLWLAKAVFWLVLSLEIDICVSPVQMLRKLLSGYHSVTVLALHLNQLCHRSPLLLVIGCYPWCNRRFAAHLKFDYNYNQWFKSLAHWHSFFPI